MSKWQKETKKEFDTPKFVRSPCELCINIETAPKTEQVDGKFGMRPMYIVEDSKLGLIYLSKKQFLIVGMAIGDLTKGTMNVTV